jgi:hypothetical protein
VFQLLAKHALAGAFDADEVSIPTRPFHQAWKAVEESAVHFASDSYKNPTRELLALRIIEIAQLGERGPNRLRDDALLFLGLIPEADTVVFVISPEAVRSGRRQWEVDKTLALSKRLLPVVFKPVPDPAERGTERGPRRSRHCGLQPGRHAPHGEAGGRSWGTSVVSIEYTRAPEIRACAMGR